MITIQHFSKKSMQATLIGQPISKFRYNETSMFGNEVSENCKVTGAHRPSYTGHIMGVNAKGQPVKSKEFYATVTIVNGIITKIT
jgi:hypothetical protein